MTTMALIRADGTVVCDQCVVADKPLRRMRGLLGRTDLPPGEGILLRPAASVHTFFMRFPIDVVFLDDELRVVRTAALPPWKAAGCRGAKAVLEVPFGTSAELELREGDRLLLAA